MRHHLGSVVAAVLLLVASVSGCAKKADPPGKQVITVSYGVPPCPAFSITEQTITIPPSGEKTFDIGGGNTLEFPKNAADPGNQYAIRRGNSNIAEVLLDAVDGADTSFHPQLVLRMSYKDCGFTEAQIDRLGVMRIRPNVKFVGSHVDRTSQKVEGRLSSLSGYAIVD